MGSFASFYSAFSLTRNLSIRYFYTLSFCRTLSLIFVMLLTSFHSVASITSDDNIPQQLKPWVKWVNAENTFLSCYVKDGAQGNKAEQRQCAWPRKITLDVQTGKVTFDTYWIVDEPSFVPLVGEGNYWPTNVFVNNNPAKVVSQNIDSLSIPGVWLAAGSHQITGEILTQSELTSLPLHIGYAQLSVIEAKKPLSFTLSDGNNLQLSSAQEAEQEMRISTKVERLLKQGHYWDLKTYIEITATDSAGEAVIGPVFPESFSFVSASLIDTKTKQPIRFVIDEQRFLHASLIPGIYQFVVDSVVSAELSTFEPSSEKSNWATTEIWGFEKNSVFGDVAFSSGNRVDNELVRLIKSNNSLSYFRLDPSKPVELKEQGKTSLTRKPELVLKRNLWLSFDNQNMKFVDKLTGLHFTGSRLETLPTVNLLSAQDGEHDIYVNQLEGGHSGVEWRSDDVNLSGLGEIDFKSNELLVAGWDQVLERVDTLLYLPPATKLIAVIGADDVRNDWLSNWELYSIFVCLFLTVLYWRTFGPLVGGVLGVTLFLCFHEIPNSFFFVNGLLLLSLQKYIPLAKQFLALRLYSVASIAGLVVCSILFFKQQVLVSVYPQLERSSIERIQHQYDEDELHDSYQSLSGSKLISQESYEAIKIKAEPRRPRLILDEGLVQAGTSMPDWSWNQYRIYWTSPVTPEQSFRLIIFTAFELLIVRVIGFCCLIGLLWMTCREFVGEFSEGVRKVIPKGTEAALLLIIIGGTGMFANEARADIPPESMLNELEQRLLKPDLCRPNCALVESAEITLDEQTLIVNFTVNVESATALPLLNISDIQVSEVGVNAKALSRAFRNSDDELVVALPPGVHQLSVQGIVLPKRAFSLVFAEKIKRVSVISDSWAAYGLDDLGYLKSKSLQFEAITPSSSENVTDQIVQTNIEPLTSRPLVVLYRSLKINNYVWMLSKAYRIAPKEGVISMKLPLLAREKVLSQESVEDGNIVLFMDRGAQQFQWRSSLEIDNGNIQLSSSESPDVVEIWSFEVSRRWHIHNAEKLSRKQLNQSLALDLDESFYLPKRGEGLSLLLSRPKAFNDTLAVVDHASLKMQPGLNISTGQLIYTVRSPRGGEQQLEIPEGVSVKSLTVNDMHQNMRLDKQQLTLTLSAGKSNVLLDFEAPAVNSLIYKLPQFNLNLPTSNLSVDVEQFPAWLLYSKGPVIGIAVLYWGQLLIFIGLALMFGRIKQLPVKRWQWIVFGLGVSFSSWVPLWMLIVFCSLLLVFQAYSDKIQQEFVLKNIQKLLLCIGVIVLIGLAVVIPMGLFSHPDMGIVGNGSTSKYWHWFADQSQGRTPEVTLVSVPYFIYKVFLVIWSLWLSFALLNWVVASWRIIFAPHRLDKSENDEANPSEP